jgi:hypothetical protein
LTKYRRKNQQQHYPPAKKYSADVSVTPHQPALSASVSAASQTTSRTTQPWVLDSGASFHVTSDSSQLVSC